MLLVCTPQEYDGYLTARQSFEKCTQVRFLWSHLVKASDRPPEENPDMCHRYTRPGQGHLTPPPTTMMRAAPPNLPQTLLAMAPIGRM